MHTFVLTLGKGLGGPARMNGALFLGDRALYFLCASTGLTGGYEFDRFGPIGAALEDYKKTGAPPVIDEASVAALVPSVPNSLAIPVERIEIMSRSFWSGSKIEHDGGQKLVVWNPGFAGAFRDVCREWAASKGIKTKGL